MTIRVFLLDDHELVREGLRAVLERERDIEIVGEAGSAIDGLRSIEAIRPDIALVDTRLPDGDGLDVCRQLSERVPDVITVILTSSSSDDVLLSALRSEAAGYVVKRAAGRDLVRSIRVAADGGSLIDRTVVGRLLERLRSGRIGETDAARLEPLSPQERRLLDHLGEGLTNRQIAERMSLAEKTVKNYVSNLLRKLGMNSRTEAAVFVTNLHAGREHQAR